jgi:hypothetical protein
MIAAAFDPEQKLRPHIAALPMIGGITGFSERRKCHCKKLTGLHQYDWGLETGTIAPVKEQPCLYLSVLVPVVIMDFVKWLNRIAQCLL